MRRLLLAAAAASAAACQFTPPTDSVQLDMLPRAAVKHGPFEVTVKEIGLVRSTSSRGMSAPFWGTKIAKLVPEGTQVAPGDPVAWLDAVEESERHETMSAELKGLVSQLAKSEEELQHEKALAALAARDAWAKLETAKLREGQAAADVERLRPLVLSGALSPEELRRYEQKHLETIHAREQAETAARKADVATVGGQGQKAADFEGVQARHAQIAREVESLEANLARLVLKAPIAGIVTYPEIAMRMASKEKRKAKVGDEAIPWRPFVEIADLAKLEVRTQVPERRVGEVVAGAAARVTVDSGGAAPIAGRVSRIESLAITRADAQATSFVAAIETRAEKVFEVSVDLQGSAAGLKPGMSVTVDLVVKKLPPSTYVPLAAIFEEGEGKVAFVVSRGRVEPRTVELGASRQDAVVVTKGLTAGEQVLLQDPRAPQRASR